MTEERFAGIVIPADLKRAGADVQAKADALGYPVKHRVDLHVGGQVIMTDVTWVYPTASWGQWSIVDGQPVRTIRQTLVPDPSGIEVVRAELEASDPVLARLWSSDGSTDTIRRDAEIRIGTLLAEASLLYTAWVMTISPPWTAWGDCDTDTIRRWVAVAREARRMHGGGR